MLKRLLLIALLIAVTALPACAAIPWIKDDYESAEREAKVRKRPLLIYFHTTWCSWCAQMEDKVFSDDEVTYQANAFVALRLNCDRRGGQHLESRFHVSSYPTVLAVTTDGTVLGRLAMYRSVPEFLQFLADCQKPAELLSTIDKQIDDGNHSPELLLKSAERHYEAGEFDMAVQRFEQAGSAATPGQDEVAASAKIGIARIKVTQGDSPAALENFRAVLKNYPGSKHLPEAFAGALMILRDEKKGDEIDALFEQFQGRFPDDPAVLNDYAKRLLETGKEPALALHNAQRAAILAPEASDCQATLAKALLANQKPVEAMEAISKAIDMQPTDKDLRVLRLDIMEAARKPPAAAAVPAAAATPAPPAASAATPPPAKP